MKYGGFWRRLIAYLMDVIPIVIVIGTIFYFFFGLDQVIQEKFSNRLDIEVYIRFLYLRNWVRELSFLAVIIYGVIMEASPFQGTIGKFIMGLKVVDVNGERLTLKHSLKRNFSKLVSYSGFMIGFIWIAFSKKSKLGMIKFQKPLLYTVYLTSHST